MFRLIRYSIFLIVIVLFGLSLYKNIHNNNTNNLNIKTNNVVHEDNNVTQKSVDIIKSTEIIHIENQIQIPLTSLSVDELEKIDGLKSLYPSHTFNVTYINIDSLELDEDHYLWVIGNKPAYLYYDINKHNIKLTETGKGFKIDLYKDQLNDLFSHKIDTSHNIYPIIGVTYK